MERPRTGLFSRISGYFMERKNRWESLCTRCSLCCYEKDIGPGGDIFINLSAPCRYLDEEKKICSVYERRFSTCGECRKVTLYHALLSRYMPATCGYVTHYRKWRLGAPRCRHR